MFYLNISVKSADIQKVKSLDNLMNYLIGFALLFNVAAYFYFKPVKLSSEVRYRQPTQSEDVDKVVNKYLQLANEAKAIEKIRLERASLEATKKIIADREQVKLKAEQEMVKSQRIVTQAEVTAMKNKYADNPNMMQKEESQPSAPVGDLDPRNMTPEERSEYRRQYIENAKAGGYLIELSDNFEIIKATKIRKPSQQSDEVRSDEY
ncbi:MAG: hypothetical protein K0R29_2461 [Pseudobdellovibrio sp.]|nr:hypothetical protein [Pseudobdellovibrio sp.]